MYILGYHLYQVADAVIEAGWAGSQSDGQPSISPTLLQTVPLDQRIMLGG